MGNLYNADYNSLDFEGIKSTIGGYGSTFANKDTYQKEMIDGTDSSVNKMV